MRKVRAMSGDSMKSPTDTNQASEDEQLELKVNRLMSHDAWCDPIERCTCNQKKLRPDMLALIRTEKLKLLAAVKSDLLQRKELKENRDDKGVLWGSYDVVDIDDIREVLTKLEAEL